MWNLLLYLLLYSTQALLQLHIIMLTRNIHMYLLVMWIIIIMINKLTT